MSKRTPLYAAHIELGARLVDFGGWEMPIQYSGIRDEHLAVRSAAGLFDISHMGEFLVEGPDAETFLDGVLTNDLRRLSPGMGQYTLLCRPDGGTLDDLFAYRIGAESFLLIVNATRIETDFEWLKARWLGCGCGDRVVLTDGSDRLSAVAVQGPRVAKFIDAVLTGPDSGAPPADVPPSRLSRNAIAACPWRGEAVWCARTGYTGEDGFELVAPNAVAPALWRACLAAGADHGIKPCGLGARDTLRTEMGFPLYGQELTEDLTPIDAGLGVFVALDKPEFCGRERMIAQKREGTARRRVAFRMKESGTPTPRPHYPLWDGEEGGVRLGEATSGTLSPSLGVGIGMAYVPAPHAEPGRTLWLEIRGKRYPCETARRPLYRRPAE